MTSPENQPVLFDKLVRTFIGSAWETAHSDQSIVDKHAELLKAYESKAIGSGESLQSIVTNAVASGEPLILSEDQVFPVLYMYWLAKLVNDHPELSNEPVRNYS